MSNYPFRIVFKILLQHLKIEGLIRARLLLLHITRAIKYSDFSQKQ